LIILNDLFFDPEDGGDIFLRNIGLSRNCKKLLLFIITAVSSSDLTTACILGVGLSSPEELNTEPFLLSGSFSGTTFSNKNVAASGIESGSYISRDALIYSV
jgi:hypothetical protein